MFIMQKKLTITVDEAVYNNLHSIIGRRKISRFINDLVLSHLNTESLRTSYESMASDSAREKEAKDWIEGLLGDTIS